MIFFPFSKKVILEKEYRATKVCSRSRQVSQTCETCFRHYSFVPACLSRGVALVPMSSAAWLGVCLSGACVSALCSGFSSICFAFFLFSYPCVAFSTVV
jgi:hypothetical protein